jgi:hypothetical protein
MTQYVAFPLHKDSKLTAITACSPSKWQVPSIDPGFKANPSQDFAHEAWNSDKVREDFAHLKGKTALYVPEVLWAERRCLVMECTSGDYSFRWS